MDLELFPSERARNSRDNYILSQIWW